MAYASTHHAAERTNKICTVVAGLVPVIVKNWHNRAINIVAMDLIVNYMELHILLQSKSSSFHVFKMATITYMTIKWEEFCLPESNSRTVYDLYQFIGNNSEISYWHIVLIYFHIIGWVVKVRMSWNRVTHLDQGDKDWIISAKCYASSDMKKNSTGIILINSCWSILL